MPSPNGSTLKWLHEMWVKAARSETLPQLLPSVLIACMLTAALIAILIASQSYAHTIQEEPEPTKMPESSYVPMPVASSSGALAVAISGIVAVVGIVGTIVYVFRRKIG